MPSRRAARRTALDILYQAESLGADAADVLRDWLADGREVPGFARELVEGVRAHHEELASAIGEHAEGWTVERMATVDRAILLLACYELRYRDDVPTAVAISEAVRAAKELSTEDSGRFVNGILGRIARDGSAG
jgi:N utilization substance protein B